MNDKQKIVEILATISDNATYEDILYELYLQYRIEKGIEEVNQEKTKTLEEVKELYS